MAIQSQISAIVASQTGKIQGELEARVLSEAFNITDKFRNECPTITGLENIVTTKNTLLKVVNSFSKTTNKFGSLANSLLPIIRAAKTLITLLKRDPTPIAVGTFPFKDWGGLIRSKTSGNQNSSADRLRKVDKLLEAVEDDVASIKALVGDVDPSLNQVRNVLNSIDTNILNCIVDIIGTTISTTGTGTINIADIRKNLNSNTESLTADQVRIKELLTKIQPSENATSGEVSAGEFTYTNTQGISYTLEILNITEIDRVIPGQESSLLVETEKVGVSFIAPKRYAQAKNKNGVVILRGPASFSADTQILLDELKFKLDNQLV
tara:strand:+ start:394 stop:1362 length:969 start_codon:yes stop_codon:yes gene_type:complete